MYKCPECKEVLDRVHNTYGNSSHGIERVATLYWSCGTCRKTFHEDEIEKEKDEG